MFNGDHFISIESTETRRLEFTRAAAETEEWLVVTRDNLFVKLSVDGTLIKNQSPLQPAYGIDLIERVDELRISSEIQIANP